MTIFCECSTPTCESYIELTHDEYRAADCRHSIVVPEHVGDSRVILRTENYVVVEDKRA